ncbi:MAG: hydrogenase iron-sulfur subunit [Bacillota bacterium]
MPDRPDGGGGPEEPRILVFSTNNISDPGIDLAGSSHLHYPPGVVVIGLPCTSGVRPEWVLYAIQRGFDGVFIAADGEECGYLSDCTERSARIFKRAQDLLTEHGLEPRRLKMAAICSVCAEPFVDHIREFSAALAELGPVTAAPVEPGSGGSAPTGLAQVRKGYE